MNIIFYTDAREYNINLYINFISSFEEKNIIK